MKHHFPVVQQVTFFAAILAGIALFIYIISEFIQPIFWAAVFAIVFYPLHLRILHFFRGRQTVSALLSLVIILLVVFIPAGLLGTLLASEARDAYTYTQNNPEAFAWYAHAIQDALVSFGIQADDIAPRLKEYGEGILSFVTGQALSIGKATLATVVKTIIMLYLLFFLLRDGERLLAYVRFFLPLGDIRERHLMHTFTSITRALFKGTVVVAIAQGFIGGILFAIAGVPNPLLFTAVMTILACIPGIGPTLIWLPVGIIQLLMGNTFGGLVILIGGFGIISVIDNVLRPLLVGKETSLPDPIIMISILGGLATFGVAGVIIGPVSAGLSVVLIGMFAEEYREELHIN